MKISGHTKFETLLVGTVGILAMVFGAYAMLARYFMPHLAAGWADELVIYLMMWAIWISASRLVAENTHVHADIIVGKLPRHWQRKLLLLNSIFGFFFCSAMAYAAWQVVMMAFKLDEKSESVLQFPIAFYDMSLLAGMLLMAYRYLEISRAHLKHGSTGPVEKSRGIKS